MTSIAGTQDLITLNTNDIIYLIKEYRELFDELTDDYVRRKYTAAVVNKVGSPLLPYFKRLIPKLVTGNLKASAAKKKLSYKKTALMLVGYQLKFGDDPNQKGWAQNFIESGTGKRYTRGSIASSYWRSDLGRGPFEQVYMQNGEYETEPPYPISFMKRAAPGQRVELARSPVGGRKGVRPLFTTWNQNKRQVAVKMLSETRKALTKAFAEQQRRQNRRI